MVDSKTHRHPDGTPIQEISGNLLRIPAYFYTDEPHNHFFAKALWCQKRITEVGQRYDFDLTLLMYLSHIKRIHQQFFRDFEDKDESLKDTKYYIRKLKNEIFSFDKVVSFENLISDKHVVDKSYQGQQCDKANLGRSGDIRKQIAESYARDPECTLQGLLLVPDCLSESEEQKLTQKYT